MKYIPIAEFIKLRAGENKDLQKEIRNKLYGRIATRKMKEGKDFIVAKKKVDIVRNEINVDYEV
jgi:hypothetical protein